MNRHAARSLLWLSIPLYLASCTGQDKALKIAKAEAALDLGEAYLAQGSHTMALRHLLDAEKFSPKDPYIQNGLGLAYLGKGRIDLAITHFKKAIEINPSYAPALNHLGCAYLARQDWPNAIQTFTLLSEDLLYATPHYALSNLGWAYFNQRQYRLALDAYGKALQTHPDFLTAHRGIGRTHMALGELQEALRHFETALSFAPQDPDLWYQKALCLEQLNRTNEATLGYQRVISIGSDNEISVAARKRLSLLR